ncbi:MAG TPA: SDR family NAD(P)-dependent oxidoreductase [Solirubrobacteraceae bacterium]|jgi:3-oxoacyl-[acyl-carrier protein] reductase
MSLNGLTAVVTGGAGAIGGEIARRLSADGAVVGIVDVTLPADWPVDRARIVDVGDAPAVADALAGSGWDPDVLVNVAGVFAFEDVLDPGRDDWERTLRVNLTGVHACCRAAAAGMRRRGFGRIISIASNAGVIGFRNMPSYCAAKAGIIGLTRSLAIDLGAYGITVNAVAPGSIAAGMGESSGWTSDPAMRAWDRARTPLRRPGTPRDVAGAVAFLASEDAAWITGQTLVVDGGFSINGGPELDPGSIS